MKGRVGVALRFPEGNAAGELELLSELGGTVPVLVRLYRHESADAQAGKKRLVRRMSESGRPVSVALVQDRKAVIDLRLWTDFVVQSVTDIGDCVDFFEVGHAINRVKWGIWEPQEYARMLEVIGRLSLENPAVKFTGPAATDFEYPYLMTALRDIH